jgi:hypothetical protein
MLCNIKIYFILLSLCLGLLMSCGEDFWRDDLSDRTRQFEETGHARYVANLSPVANQLPNVSGVTSIRINQDLVSLNLEINNVPARLSLAHYRFTADNCAQLDATENGEMTNMHELGVKSLNHTEVGARSSILVGADSDIVPTIEGHTLVVYASAASEDAASFPLACGQVFRMQDERIPVPMGPTEQGGVGGGVGGAVAGGVAGEVAGGFQAGVQGGFQAGVQAGNFGGVAGGMQAGGVQAGTFGGVAGGMQAGGVQAGTFGGVAGGMQAGVQAGTLGGVNAGTFQGGAGTTGVGGGVPNTTPNTVGGTPGFF